MRSLQSIERTLAATGSKSRAGAAGENLQRLSAFRPKVLIVEDEYFTADDLARQFAAAGSEVVGFAPSLVRAQRILDSAVAIDVAILDVRLEDGTVFELADVLRSKGICLVFYTATESADVPRRFADVPVVSKPLGADHVYLEALRVCSTADNSRTTH